jgi:tetratricopeptide (TPR) repeat protein
VKTLDDDTHSRIVALSKEGDSMLEQGHVKEAIAKYVDALRLLPKPAHEWEAATWLFTAIGDAYWKIKDYERAYKALHSALRSPGGIGNPFIHLRMGQVQYELGNREKAVDELLRAYMGDGKEIFAGEDPKYFEAIAHLI